MPEIFRQNYSRSDDRAGQGSAASLVNPGNARDPCGTQFLFVAKSATAAHAAPYPKFRALRSKNLSEKFSAQRFRVHSRTAVASFPLRVRR